MQAEANMNAVFTSTSFEKGKIYNYIFKENEYYVKDIKGKEQVLSPVEFDLFFTKI